MGDGKELSLGSLGSYLPDFVDQVLVESKYTCPLCRCILSNPFSTFCGHNFCEACLHDFISKANGRVLCPINDDNCEYLNIDDDSISPDYAVRREIKKLQVYCPNHLAGCQETVQWVNLSAHIKDCTYTLYPCAFNSNGCEEMTKLENKAEHENSCSFRAVQCKDCHIDVFFKDLKKHENVDCEFGQVVCPYGCDAKIIRNELDHHEKLCPKRLANCKFESVGCEFKGTTVELQKHEEQAMNSHVLLCAYLLASRDSKIAQLTNELDRVSSENTVLKHEMTRNQQELQEIRKKYSQLESEQTKYQMQNGALLDRLHNLESLIKPMQSKQITVEHMMSEIKQQQSENNAKLFELASEGSSAPGTLDSRNERRVNQMEHEHGIMSMRLAELNDLTLSLCDINYNGLLVWRVDDYSSKKSEARRGKTKCLSSRPFYAGQYSYKMCCRLYLNGDGLGKGKYLSLFFVIMKGKYDEFLKWPFQQKVTFKLLDQTGNDNHITDTFEPDSKSLSFARPTHDSNIASGCPLFIKHTKLEASNSPYLVRDTIYFKIKVDMENLNHELT